MSHPRELTHLQESALSLASEAVLKPSNRKVATWPSHLFDPFAIGTALARAQLAWLSHPDELAECLTDLADSGQRLFFQSLNRAWGIDCPDYVPSVEADERFTDAEWTEKAYFDLLKQCYLWFSRWLERAVYDSPGLPKKDRRTAAFWVRQWLNALAPTNFLFTNPVALRSGWESAGSSVLRGFSNWLDDIEAGDLQIVDATPFKVGVNIANTPGGVVFRNELLEVIQYEPAHTKVHAIPIVIISPWINKYYILDLNEKKSLIRYLLGQGFNVFVTSWKNPTPEMADVTFDDYMLKGALAAIEAARNICAAKQVHAVGYCIGGTALAALMAWLNRKYPRNMPVAHWTLLASLADFSRPGEIEAFINKNALATIDNLMAQKGGLGGKELAGAFRMLRPNSLIWHYFVHRYLYGEPMPASDVLFWNMDSTRLPRPMHSFYLREFYLENRLARPNAVCLGELPIDLSLITQPLYAVGAREDHITPWRGTFHTAHLIKGPVRYALSTSGHILGIINPPVNPPKREYWVGDVPGMTEAKAWRAKQKKVPGSWWDDWAGWLRKRCGPMVEPTACGSQEYPVLCQAPGTYVFEK
jgi:polyhydroxyalkanoate synthase